MFEKNGRKKMLRRKREELTGEWIKLHSKELCDMYSSLYSSVRTRKRFAGYVVRMEKRKMV
jgi:ribosomal protein S17E